MNIQKQYNSVPQKTIEKLEPKINSILEKDGIAIPFPCAGARMRNTESAPLTFASNDCGKPDTEKSAHILLCNGCHDVLEDAIRMNKGQPVGMELLEITDEEIAANAKDYENKGVLGRLFTWINKNRTQAAILMATGAAVGIATGLTIGLPSGTSIGRSSANAKCEKEKNAKDDVIAKLQDNASGLNKNITETQATVQLLTTELREANEAKVKAEALAKSAVNDLNSHIRKAIDASEKDTCTNRHQIHFTGKYTEGQEVKVFFRPNFWPYQVNHNTPQVVKANNPTRTMRENARLVRFQASDAVNGVLNCKIRLNPSEFCDQERVMFVFRQEITNGQRRQDLTAFEPNYEALVIEMKQNNSVTPPRQTGLYEIRSVKECGKTY